MIDGMEEEVVLFPLRSQDPAVKVLRVARVAEGKLDNSQVHHIAGGPYKGIIVSKATQVLPSKDRPHVVREFVAHVHDTKARTAHRDAKENRKVFMWFKDGKFDRELVADKFFKMLIDPDNFPKDYISFVKRVIILTKAFPNIRTIELELSPAHEYLGSPPISPGYRLSWIAKPENFTQDDSSKHVNESPKHVNESPTVVLTDSTEKKQKSRPSPPPRRSSRPTRNGSVPEGSKDRSQKEAERDGEVEEVITQTTEAGVSSSPGQVQEVVQTTTTTHTVRQTMTGPPPPDDDDPAVTASHRLLVLTLLEDAFPNALNAQQIASSAQLTQVQADRATDECSDKGLIQKVDGERWIRISTVRRKPKSESRSSGLISSRISSSYTSSKHDFKVVPQIPTLPDAEQPTVAIITLVYCEKQAVDAMMDNKTTYVRYKTEGEGQVYTIGKIGGHRLVSTKLIRVGSGQGATVSAGNLITRLLGTFNKIQHVFLVGVGGSIPDYNKDQSHVRCGDVVISKPQFDGGPTYVSVTDVDGNSQEGNVSFGTRAWEPKDENLMKIVSDLCRTYSPRSMVNSTIHQNIQSGLGELGGQELSYERPSADADRLYKLSEDGAWREVDHPSLSIDSSRRMYPERPVLHFGSIGTGYDLLIKDNVDLRKQFALFNEIKAMDVGYQAVLESIDGNRTESFWLVRGIADYMDGMSSTEWQPYASLAAAAVTKTLLTRLSPTRA